MASVMKRGFNFAGGNPANLDGGTRQVADASLR
jgi:hypothetical protein